MLPALVLMVVLTAAAPGFAQDALELADELTIPGGGEEMLIRGARSSAGHDRRAALPWPHRAR